MTTTKPRPLTDHQRAILRWVVDGADETRPAATVPFRSWNRIANSLIDRGLIRWSGSPTYRWEATEAGLALDPPDQV